MKTFFSPVTALCSLLCIHVVGAADPSALSERLQNSMNQFASAMKKQDRIGMNKFVRTNYASDYRETRDHGRTTGPHIWLREMREKLADAKAIKSVQFRVLDVKVAGNTATARESFELVKTVANLKDPSVTRDFIFSIGWDMTFVKSKDKWLAKRGVRTKDQVRATQPIRTIK